MNIQKWSWRRTYGPTEHTPLLEDSTAPTSPQLTTITPPSYPKYTLTKLPDYFTLVICKDLLTAISIDNQPLSISYSDSTYTLITKNIRRADQIISTDQNKLIYICLKLEMPDRTYCPPISKLLNIFARHDLPTLHVSSSTADYILFERANYKQFKNIIKNYN